MDTDHASVDLITSLTLPSTLRQMNIVFLSPVFLKLDSHNMGPLILVVWSFLFVLCDILVMFLPFPSLHHSFLSPPCPPAVVLADGATIVANPISNPFSAAPAATTVVQTHSQSASTNAPAQGSSPRPSILRKKPAADGWVDPVVPDDTSSSRYSWHKQ